MTKKLEKNYFSTLLPVVLAGWLVPGGGYFVLGEKKRAAVVFAAIVITFLTGLYIGSIGVVDPIGARLWYIAQMSFSPVVAIIGRMTRSGGYPVYAKPAEIGQIYTSVAGLLNLLCIINSTHMAHLKATGKEDMTDAV
jgi:hypothetical protein